MRILLFVLMLAGLPVMAESEYPDLMELVETINSQPQTRNELTLDPDNFYQYEQLASEHGFTYAKPYTHTRFVDIKRQHDIGAAGHYEFLKHSAGGTGFDTDAELIKRQNSAQYIWQSMYFSNHDFTWLVARFKDESNTRAWDVIVKIEPGRMPKIHKR